MTVSVLAQQLANLLSALTEPVPFILASRPVMSMPASDTGPLAAALREALEHSGLFYESHLKQWHQGQRERVALLAEPQATRATLATRATQDLGSLIATAEDQATVRVIRAQLDTLDTGCIRWEGELWPGMAMQWQLQRDNRAQDHVASDHSQHSDEFTEPTESTELTEPKRAWMSTLQLTLPVLGDIRAQLTIQDHTLGLTLLVSDRQSVNKLDHERHGLVVGLARAGIALSSFKVQGNEAA